MITMARVDEIRSALAVAGAGWADVARRLPEYGKHHLGKPGPSRGHVRPWVLLNDHIEGWDAPPRLVRHETGYWFLKGEHEDTFIRRTAWPGETPSPPFRRGGRADRSSPPPPSRLRPRRPPSG